MSVLTFLTKSSRRLLLLTVFSLFIYGSFFMLSYVVNPEKTLKNFAGRDGHLLGVLSFVAESVITHYVLIFVVILPTMHKRRSRGSALIITLLLFIVKFAFNYGSYLYKHGDASAATGLSAKSLKGVLIIYYLFTLVSSLSIALLVEWVNKSKERILLEKQRTEAELIALKHQINPHFLFNSLSFI